jgi:hypothetical protein
MEIESDINEIKIIQKDVEENLLSIFETYCRKDKHITDLLSTLEEEKVEPSFDSLLKHCGIKK